MKKIFLFLVPMILFSLSATAAVTIVELTGNVVRPVTITVGSKVYRDVFLPYYFFVKKIDKVDTPIRVEAEGYRPYDTVVKRYSDPLSKPPRMMTLTAEMKKIGAPDVSDTQNEERVTRDNPGGTSLEGTVVRWFFDSEPRGARIFWRVVSNAPQEVKNTNELYLGTIPYEETRSFNIQGLTYENSHNVQIEIKVTKQGYEDQIKRFNVRQAIDQQEISGFFDMVAKPNDM